MAENQPNYMPKQVYVYKDNLNDSKNCVVTSMMQLIDLTGYSYRSLQRIFNGTDILYDKKNYWVIFKCDFIKDKRIRNHNPKFNK